MDLVATRIGDTGYAAMYQRTLDEPPERQAEGALRELCPVDNNPG